jgi:excisionase family DNA binding protein
MGKTMTPPEVGANLKVSTETAMRLLRAGVLPGFKVGRRWRVDSDALEAWKERAAARPEDPNRIPPRSTRSDAALARRTG